MSLPEARKRLDKAADQIAAAQAVFDNGNFAPTVSVAYYASFHAAVGFLLKQDCPPSLSGRWSHGYVQAKFRVFTGVAGERLLGKILAKLYSGRMAADYSVREVTRSDAGRALVWAKQVADFCNSAGRIEVPTEPVPSENV